MIYAAIDVTVVAAAAAGCAALSSNGAPSLIATIVCMVLGLVLAGLYRPYRRWHAWLLGVAAFKGLAIAWGLAFIAAAIFRDAMALPTVGSGLLASTGLVLAWRLAAFPQFAQWPVRRVAIIGADEAGLALAAAIHRHHDAQYKLAGFLEDRPAGQWSGQPIVLGGTKNLPALAEEGLFDTVVVPTSQPLSEATVMACLDKGLTVMTLPGLYERLTGSVPVRLIDASWFLHALREGDRRLYALGKRLLDIIVAVLGLIGLAFFLPAIALAIRLGGGPGSIFYSQVRVGYGGRLFKMHKFRTMCQDAEAGGAVWATVNDARVTKVGALLRQTRLDELPQLWNVLRGAMSIVGPRPERPEFTQDLERRIPFYAQRHLVPPGVTGWAQVCFPYGASVEDALQKLQYDLYYLKNRSLIFDLCIMFRTVGVMMRKMGAR